MNRSELVTLLTQRQPHLKEEDVDLSVRLLLDGMATALAARERIEIRGFGSFSIHLRPPRVARNPRTGDMVELPARHVPHFRPGKELRLRVAEVTPVADEG